MPINKKTIIQIVVIVVAFGGSGLVLYNGYFKNKADSLAAVQNSQGVMSGDLGNSGVAATGGSSQQILPYGASLDFDKVFKKRILNFGLVDYPKLQPQLDVGISETDLVQAPLPVEQSGTAQPGKP